MQDLINYIETYGNLDFNEKPCNEVDNLIFSQLIYNEFGDIAEGKERITLAKAALDFFEQHTNEELEAMLSVVRRASRLLALCAKTKRFGEVELCNYVNNVDDALDKQICAVNFLLCDGAMLVAFRGTDATVAGFKESAMLAYMFPVPAQIEALHYFQESAMLHDGAVRLCGHSKGGNLAVYAAVNCSNNLQLKIENVYAFDAPGFPKWFFERYDYKQIEDKLCIINPQGSIVGRALYMAKKPIIVCSNEKRSRQHMVSSWVIDNDKFERAEGYDEESDKFSAYLNDLVVYIGKEDLEAFYDAMEQTANQMGVTDYYDIKNVDTNLMAIIIDSIQTLSPEQKERFRSITFKVATDFAKDYVSTTATKAKLYVKSITNKIPFTVKKKPDKEDTNEQ